MHKPSQISQPAKVLTMIAACCCFSACLRAQSVQKSISVGPPLLLTITAEKPAAESGTPVWVVAKIENKSDHDLPIYRAISNDMDQGGWVYRVDVHDDKGVASSEREFYRIAQERDPEVGVRKSGWVTKLKPGKTVTDRVNVAKLYDLSGPGKYTIQFQRFDPESKTFVRSNEITVTVTP